ncbi:15866_t:CDS:2, partial [Racocetra fulgida]
QKNLRNKKFQSFNESVDIPTDSNASITIKYEIKQHTPAGQKLQMQPPTPLMFSEMSIEDPDKIWESVNSKLHSVFGYGEKLETTNTFGKELKQLENFNEVQKPSIADALLSSGVEVTHTTNQLVISENNNSIEFGKLNHFLNLTKAYTALQKLVIQDPLRENKSKTIKYKIANSIPLGEKSTSKIDNADGLDDSDDLDDNNRLESKNNDHVYDNYEDNER